MFKKQAKGVSPISAGKPKVYKVGAVNKAIKKVLDTNPYLQDIIVVGEISNFKPKKGGHLYFSLKDEDAKIDVVMYEWFWKDLNFTPENGMKVFVKGSVSYYDKGGQLQLLAQKMAADGVGNLHQQFEEMKRKLSKEGLFDPKFKKKIPKFPKIIGVVTSDNGAAVRDIITTIRRRYPIAKIELYPVVVQGVNAAPSIVKALRYFNGKKTADVLIVGRGGGSIEDLWAFNEEIVVREIFHCTIPVVSAVGHETDTTISDFVADVRAATPTAAAELVTPVTLDKLLDDNQKLSVKISSLMERSLQRNRKQMEIILKNIAYRHPQKVLGDMIQSKDRILEDIDNAMILALDKQKSRLNQLKIQLKSNEPSKQINESKLKIAHLISMLNVKMQSATKEKRNLFNEKLIQLDGLSPLKIMSRGYSLSFKENKVIKTIVDISSNDEVTVKLSDGQFDAVIKNIYPNRER